MRPTPIYSRVFTKNPPKEETLLGAWLKARDISMYEFARRLSVDPKTIYSWCHGQSIPDLIRAFRIDKETEGAVPPASWLGTELGRIRWNEITFDWNGWHEKKAEERARRAAKTRSAR